jgi:hypothetical protein
MSVIRLILIVVAAGMFATACLLFEGSPVAGNLFVKAAMALWVLLFGMSAIFITIWYYLNNSDIRRES